jgi:hypothetical protein
VELDFFGGFVEHELSADVALGTQQDNNDETPAPKVETLRENLCVPGRSLFVNSEMDREDRKAWNGQKNQQRTERDKRLLGESEMIKVPAARHENEESTVQKTGTVACTLHRTVIALRSRPRTADPTKRFPTNCARGRTRTLAQGSQALGTLHEIFIAESGLASPTARRGRLRALGTLVGHCRVFDLFLDLALALVVVTDRHLDLLTHSAFLGWHRHPVQFGLMGDLLLL